MKPKARRLPHLRCAGMGDFHLVLTLLDYAAFYRMARARLERAVDATAAAEPLTPNRMNTAMCAAGSQNATGSGEKMTTFH